MEVTLQDIAQQLDISAATVSRSLRQDTLIHPETRARVNEAAQRMGYKVRARRPRRPVESGATSRTIGLLLRHNSLVAPRQDMNLMKMMAGIMAVTDAGRMLLQIHTIHHDETRLMAEDPLVVPPMVEHEVCQAFIVHGEQDERDIAFLAERAPVVSMGRVYRNLPIDAAVGDNVEGVRGIIAHLVELGHRRLAWVDMGARSSFMQARQAGFIQGCLEHHLGFTPCSLFGQERQDDFSIRDNASLIEALNAGVTAFVCGNDGIATRVIEALEEAGQRVPEDVSVTGFDAAMPSGVKWHLTSVDPHFFEIGQVTAQIAMQRMAQPLSQHCIVSVHGNIVRGNTTAPLSGTCHK